MTTEFHLDRKFHAQMALDLNQTRAEREHHTARAQVVSDKPRFYWVSGALMCDREVQGLTQELRGQDAAWYGGRHFVCETIGVGAARMIAAALGGEWTNL